MKTPSKFLSAGLVALSLLSCRNNEVPEDIHEHEEANKVTVTITETGTTNTQTVNYIVGSGADKGITLAPGKTYNTNVKFYHQHNGVSEDMTDEIIKEKDEHFLVYQFVGITGTVTRTSADPVRKDDKKLGLNTLWNITAAAPGSKAVIKLIHLPATVDDAANGGAGAYTGGETDVSVEFAVN